MPQVTITRRMLFNAAHRVHNPALSDAENWGTQVPDGEHPLVSLVDATGSTLDRVHPLADLRVSQRVVPLDPHRWNG